MSDLENEKDEDAPSWVCGKFTEFSPKQWTPRRTPVSIRELSKMAGPHCVPDILITELEVRRYLKISLFICNLQLIPKCDILCFRYPHFKLLL